MSAVEAAGLCVLLCVFGVVVLVLGVMVFAPQLTRQGRELEQLYRSLDELRSLVDQLQLELMAQRARRNRASLFSPPTFGDE